jgi:hypothetical protein
LVEPSISFHHYQSWLRTPAPEGDFIVGHLRSLWSSLCL